MAAAEAAGDAADVTASYSTLSAPFDGVVTDRSIDPGAVAAPGLPLLTVEDMSGYRLEVRLDEARAAGVTLGSPASVRLDTATERSSSWIPARVSEIARLDPTAHSFVAKLDLPSGAGLRSGLFGRARFEGAPRRATAAPATALVRRGQVTFVFVATGDTARLRPVSVGQPVDDRVEILAGLSAGESVVVNPPAELTDGSRLATTGVRMDPASERRGAAPAGARP